MEASQRVADPADGRLRSRPVLDPAGARSQPARHDRAAHKPSAADFGLVRGRNAISAFETQQATALRSDEALTYVNEVCKLALGVYGFDLCRLDNESFAGSGSSAHADRVQFSLCSLSARPSFADKGKRPRVKRIPQNRGARRGSGRAALATPLRNAPTKLDPPQQDAIAAQ